MNNQAFFFSYLDQCSCNEKQEIHRIDLAVSYIYWFATASVRNKAYSSSESLWTGSRQLNVSSGIWTCGIHSGGPVFQCRREFPKWRSPKPFLLSKWRSHCEINFFFEGVDCSRLSGKDFPDFFFSNTSSSLTSRLQSSSFIPWSWFLYRSQKPLYATLNVSHKSMWKEITMALGELRGWADGVHENAVFSVSCVPP